MPFIENVSAADIANGNHRDSSNAVLIQIVDPGSEFPRAKTQFISAWQFKFFDADPTDKEFAIGGITPEIANSLVIMLKDALNENRDVIVHCVGGVARSGAVVEAGIAMGFEDVRSYRCPNLTVKHMMFDMLRLPYDKNEKRYFVNANLNDITL